MNTTTLVHESFMRLVNASGLRLEDRHHFFAYAAKTMRNVIIDAARAHLADRRGGGAEHVTLGADDAQQLADSSVSDELLTTDLVMAELTVMSPSWLPVDFSSVSFQPLTVSSPTRMSQRASTMRSSCTARA